MEFEQIKELIALLKDNEISEFLYEEDGKKLRIRTKDFGKVKQVAAPALFPQMPNFVMPPVTNAAANNTETQAPAQIEDKTKVENSTPAPEAPKAATNYIEIKSPMVGTFYRSSSPDKPPFVKVGDTVNSNSTICIIEAMKLFNEVKAELSGKIVKVMVDDASPVEYDQVLFLVEPL